MDRIAGPNNVVCYSEVPLYKEEDNLSIVDKMTVSFIQRFHCT